MNASQRRAIFERLRAANPHPTTELHYHTPFELLVAVILSAQATDRSVNQATATLFPLANTPEKMLSLGEEGLIRQIRRIGLYKTKAKNLIATCQILLDKHGGAGSPGSPARRRPQDRERGAQHRIRRSHHRGGYPHLPGGQPHRPGAGQDRAGGGAEAAAQCARRIPP